MKPHITSGMLKNGAVIFAASFAAVKGYKIGCQEFEKLVPAVTQKIVLAKAIGDTIAAGDDDDEDDDD